MNRSAIVLVVAALSLGAERAAAQTMQPDPAAPQTSSDSATVQDRAKSLESGTSGIGSGDHAVRVPEDRVRGNGDSPPANPPAKDETVGVGGSVDRAPRDIREAFDE